MVAPYKALIALFSSYKIDGYISPLTDNHLNEFVADADNHVKFLTGFTGTAGTAVTFKTSRGLLVDGRYYLEAADELTDYRLLKSKEYTLSKAIEEAHPKRVGVDLQLLSYKRYRKLKKSLSKKAIELVGVDDLVNKVRKGKRAFNEIVDIENIFYEIRENEINLVGRRKPGGAQAGKGDGKEEKKILQTIVRVDDKYKKYIKGVIRLLMDDKTTDQKQIEKFIGELMEKNIAGGSRAEKIERVRQLLESKKGRKSIQGTENKQGSETDKLGDTGGGVVITELDTIAWLFNLRGRDIPNNLVFYSYAYVDRKQAVLFTNSEVSIEDVTVRKYDEFEKFLETVKDKPIKISGEINAFLGNKLPNKQFISDIRNMQSTKTIQELFGLLLANLLDSVVLTELFQWIDTAASSGDKQVTEQAIANKLAELKKNRKSSIDASFNTLASIGRNSSHIHHTPGQTTLGKSDEIVLLDTGSQYIFGTTDITRTIGVSPNDNRRRMYTLVLKALIAGKSHQSASPSGDEIDKSTRKPLQSKGYDYDTATGHGVGAGLYVHEHPPSIGSDEATLLSNQAFSIEPGYYEPNEFGIRLEDVLTYRKDHPFLTDLTYVPYDRTFIDLSLLSEQEITYLNRYNKFTRALLTPLLTGAPLNYLRKNTEPLKWPKL